MASTSVSKVAGAGKRGRVRHAASHGHGVLTPYFYILPAFSIYAAFLLYPLVRAAQFSLFSWDTISPAVFVGFQNYIDLAKNEDLRNSFTHAFVLIFFYAVLPLAVGLVIAAILNRAKVRGMTFFRTVIFLPQVIAMVVVAVAWTGSRWIATDFPQLRRRPRAPSSGNVRRRSVCVIWNHSLIANGRRFNRNQVNNAFGSNQCRRLWLRRSPSNRSRSRQPWRRCSPAWANRGPRRRPPADPRTPDMVRRFTQSQQAAGTAALAGPDCIAAGQRLTG
jgi:flagellar biosynthesis protein FliQ